MSITVEGRCDDRFDRIRRTFEENFSVFREVGASFALSVEGEMVVDVWGGYADADNKRPWREDTIVNVFSSSKTLTFLSALLLVERGQLDLNAPVARYWPEFGTFGKEKILVHQVLTHSAGVPAFHESVTTNQLYDWDHVIRNLEHVVPLWKPGTAIGYHAFTQGYLIGELVRRIDGRRYGEFIAQEICSPLGADFHVGLPAGEHARVADLVPAREEPPPMVMEEGSIAAKVFANMALTNDDMLSKAWRLAEIPAVNGHGNARSLVQTQTPLANNGRAGGRQLISSKLCQAAGQRWIGGEDLVLGITLDFALGYALPSAAICFDTDAEYLWWGGAGGSLIVVDPSKRICFSYVMNQLDNFILGDPRSTSLGKSVYAVLGSMA